MTRVPVTSGILLLEVTLFALASLTHGGLLLHGFEHARAAAAEAVIATVLGLGFVACLARPPLARRLALAVQLFAILGVLTGLSMIAIGVGPRTRFDLVLHGAMLVTLVTGFVVSLKHH